MAIPTGSRTLRAAGMELDVFPVGEGGGVRVRFAHSGGRIAAFRQSAPIAIEICDAAGTASWRTAGYDTVARANGGLVCAGTVQTPGGTQFQVVDTYKVLPDAFAVTRTVRVASPGPDDRGFSSRFLLEPEASTTMRDNDFFVPGNWYGQNAHVPPRALAAGMEDRYYYLREDRLPLPLVAQRDRRTGATLVLAHLDGNPTTFAGEDGLDRIIDARMQFGALGIVNTERPCPAFVFPGTEGERTYIRGGSRQGNRWALRSHPVAAGVPHTYRLLIRLNRTPSFPDAVRQAWRTVYTLAKPPVLRANLSKVVRDGMELLSTVCRPVHGVPDVPFAAVVPDGKVSDTSSQMGFVGQALPAAALLLRHGLETRNADAAQRAAQIVDFWAANSMSPADVPRTWYDIHPDGTFTWRNYHTFLRVASDGLAGALRAWSVSRAHGRDRPEWLAFCRRTGDWLLRAQNPDGSWAREYDFTGRVVNPATDTTDQAIPFLVDLGVATGDARYKQSALRAGEFCWRSVHLRYAYVGGTPDNPNVLDKEGGMMALAAFLALYDITNDKRWLAAAAQAADFCETWVYCWNIPIPPGDPKVVFPRNRTTHGVSLIATGHSGADAYMAAAPFYYYRLFLLTGDAHFRDVAEMLLHDTKQMTDWDGTLRYAHPGLLTEALSLPPPRGHGQIHWLPWLTVAILEPLVNLKQTFGDFAIDRIERLPRAERLRRAAEYSRTRGLLP